MHEYSTDHLQGIKRLRFTRARNAHETRLTFLRTRFVRVCERVSFAFSSRFIPVYSAFHSRLPLISFAFDPRFIHSRLLRVRCPASHVRSLASQPYFSACACGLGRGEGEGRKNTSGDYSTVFVSPAGICGSPMKLQQPCDIAERYVTCTQQG